MTITKNKQIAIAQCIIERCLFIIKAIKAKEFDLIIHSDDAYHDQLDSIIQQPTIKNKFETGGIVPPPTSKNSNTNILPPSFNKIIKEYQIQEKNNEL